MNTIYLPDKKTMFRLLCTVNNNEWHKRELYPKFLKASGQEKGPHGIVGLLMDAVDTCTAKYHMSKPAVNSIRKQIPKFIDAIVISEDVRERAKILFEKAWRDAIAISL